MRPTPLLLPNGETTRVVDTGGDGPVVVLVHGLGNSLEIWARVLPRLARTCRVIAFDLPGFGQASRPDAAHDGPFFAAQVLALLDALELERAVLVGNSLGAGAILHLSALAPRRIARAVLAAPGGIGRRTNVAMRAAALPLIGGWLARPTRFNNRMTLQIALHDHRHLTADLLGDFNRHAALPGSERAFVRTLQAGVTLAGSRDCAHTKELAARFPAPALVVWGRQDRVFPVDYAAKAAELIPDSQLTLIDACGHYPHWEQPEVFVGAVEAFVR
jgi:pimeloyl-ACP methyl ester carboxylesterase